MLVLIDSHAYKCGSHGNVHIAWGFTNQISFGLLDFHTHY